MMNFTQPYIFQYDTETWKFREVMENILETSDLENIHTVKQYDRLIAAKTDQATDWHKKFYGNLHKWHTPYQMFLAGVVAPYFSIPAGELVYQKVPTFRAHLVGNVGVGEFHRDSDYNHSDYELNLWLPVTDTYETNTIWIHVNGDDKPAVPYSVKYGQVLVFNGVKYLHGNYINETQVSRVSVDFRICTKSSFVPSEKATLNTKKSMVIGDYFELI